MTCQPVLWAPRKADPEGTLGMGWAPSTRAKARGGRSREVEDGRRVGNNQIGQGGWGAGAGAEGQP